MWINAEFHFCSVFGRVSAFPWHETIFVFSHNIQKLGVHAGLSRMWKWWVWTSTSWFPGNWCQRDMMVVEHWGTRVVPSLNSKFGLGFWKLLTSHHTFPLFRTQGLAGLGGWLGLSRAKIHIGKIGRQASTQTSGSKGAPLDWLQLCKQDIHRIMAWNPHVVK